MSALISTFLERYGDWQTAIVQHLQVSLAALLMAILLALPLAIWLSYHKRAAEIILQITGILQTIPSLAILGLLIPFIGIGTLPAVVTLVVYGLFPIVQNTITAFWELDPVLEEAATAFGMTRWEKLKKYQLALAMPVIMSGVRTSAVMIVGTATLAALIGAGGLGSFILLGIDRNDSALILIGAISSALLAVIMSLVIKFLEKRRLRTIVLSFLAMLTLLGASYAPSLFKQEQETIVIAGKLGAEPDILIHMYKELIEQDTDLKVELKSNFGKTSFLYEALKSGSIDIYPEFTGTITSSLLTNPPASSTDADTVYQQARDGILKQDNLAYLKPMQYQNTYALAVPKAYAQENDLSTISDLSKVQSTAKAGFSLEFIDREDGGKGLTSLYGLNLSMQSMEPSLRYQAVSQGSVQIVDAYSTDSQLISYDLVTLEDDKHLFPPYQGAPLLRQETLDKHPEIATALNKLAGKITDAEMTQMNYAVDVEGKSAASVAHDYLVKEGLVSQ